MSVSTLYRLAEIATNEAAPPKRARSKNWKKKRDQPAPAFALPDFTLPELALPAFAPVACVAAPPALAPPKRVVLLDLDHTRVTPARPEIKHTMSLASHSREAAKHTLEEEMIRERVG